MTVDHALGKLGAPVKPHAGLFTHGSLLVALYKPDKIDRQEPHTRDEIYVIASGSGHFVKDDVRSFDAGAIGTRLTAGYSASPSTPLSVDDFY